MKLAAPFCMVMPICIHRHEALGSSGPIESPLEHNWLAKLGQRALREGTSTFHQATATEI